MNEETPGASSSLPGGLVGRLVEGRYRVDSELGRGGMGSVFLATDEKMGRQVVLKVPDPQLLQRPGFRERFELETRSLVDLSHPHIVQVLDVGTVDSLPYLVLQYLRGGSLEEQIEERGGRLEISEILGWLPDVARTLDFIHGLGIVHRDVKPANILFDEHGHVFLADFGIVKALGKEDTGITQTGTTPGTPTYMSPEAAMAAPLDGRADQYALGGVVYRALSGKPATEGTTPYEIMLKKHTEDPVPLATVAPGVAEGVSRVVMRALARLPEARFPSCVAFSEAFAADADRGPAPGETEPSTEAPDVTGTLATPAFAIPVPTEETPELAPLRRSRIPTLGVALAVAALAVLGWLLLGRGEGGTAAHRVTLIVEAPQNGVVTGAARIAVRGRVEGEGAAALLINGRPVALENMRFESEVDAVEELRFEVRDREGRTLATDRREIVVDRTSPEVIVDPVPGPVREAVVVITGRVSEAGCAVTVGEVSAEVRGTVFEARVALVRGSNEIIVVARDAAGNRTLATVLVELRPESALPEAPADALPYSPEVRRALITLAESPEWQDPAWSDSGALEISSARTGLTFVLIPAGHFQMGSNAGAEDEKPVRRVTVPAFLLSKTECTQSAWVKGKGENGSGWTGETLPVENLSWNEVQRWCGANGLRLPSEAEWEYACRAGGAGRWCFGDDEFRLGEFAWFQDNSDQKTHPVGKKRPNSWGLFDTHGNVWEWCADRKSDSYSVAAADGRAYEGGSSERRVLRGGCWYVGAEFCRSARRNAAGPGARSSFNGFRPARSLP